MAEDSAFWNGTTVGHAASTDVWSAPYSSEEFSDVLSYLLASNMTTPFVIPLQANELEVTTTSPVSLGVLVKSGYAFFRGKIYKNTSDKTLTLATADPTNPRIDGIMLRLNLLSSTQTAEVVAVTGTPAATPAFPVPTQTSTTFEYYIAYVWVAAAATTIAATEIHDFRLFADNYETQRNWNDRGNDLVNSEYLAFSSLQAGSPTSLPPDSWTLVNTATFASATKPPNMARGRAVRITASASNAGMEQTIPVKASTKYSIRINVNVNAGDVGRVVVTTNSASPNTVTRLVRFTGAWLEIVILYPVEADATTLTLRLLANSNTDIVDYGQALIVAGHITGPFRPIHEIIFFNQQVNDTNWDGDAKSTGTTTLDLDTDFGGLLAFVGIQAIFVQIQANDSGSAASVTFLNLNVGVTPSLSAVSLWIQGVPNDVLRTECGWVYLHPTNRTFQAQVQASGAGTLDAWIRIYGILT